jgi:hypothetical protein
LKKFIPRISFLVATLHVAWIAPALSGDFSGDAPWEHPDAVVVIDAYSENTFDLLNAFKDSHHPAAIIWQATKGHSSPTKTSCSEVAELVTIDCSFDQVYKLSNENNILFGAYHFGHTGDVEAQANAFADIATKYKLKFLTLDVDGDPDGVNMTISEAANFLNIVYKRVNIRPILYTTRNVAKEISHNFDKNSIFAKSKLWIAAPVGAPNLSLAPIKSNVWDEYSVWQFNDDNLCVPSDRKKYLVKNPNAPPCPIKMNGIESGYDVNIFNGSKEDLQKLF